MKTFKIINTVDFETLGIVKTPVGWITKSDTDRLGLTQDNVRNLVAYRLDEWENHYREVVVEKFPTSTKFSLREVV